MGKKVLVATVKPFASEAIKQIKELCEQSSYELQLLEKYESNQELIAAVSTAEALIVRSDKITADVIQKAKNLKIIVRGGAGYDNIDLEAASEKGIVVMNTPGQNSNAVAELAFGMMVYIARGQFNGKPGRELKGKKIGIHAYGNVGKNVARIAKGFDMEVWAFDPYVDNEKIKADGVKPIKDVKVMYKNCDYISLNLPSIPTTRESINYELMKDLPQNATIVNTARKEVVCENSLIKLLSEREDLKYVSDIAPIKKDEMLEKFGNRVFFTPKKMGAQTLEANVNAGVAAINQIIGYFEKNDTTFQVNKK
ncbi:MAG: NAD(P)-dependent oxidoreductase [Candidatus Cloacimonadota bacterium]|nr:NAD(P)-dependent oxidoreductase [Candidatus Cloacimonadota bacterium]